MLLTPKPYLGAYKNKYLRLKFYKCVKKFFKAFVFLLVLFITAKLFYDARQSDTTGISASVVFSIFAILFSCGAYLFTKEKFRLDLFEKRWEVYTSLLDFCSYALNNGNLRERIENNSARIEALKAAHHSFRAQGWHKSQVLFGSDVHNLLNDMDKTFYWLISHQEPPEEEGERNQWAKKQVEHLDFIFTTMLNLPLHFRPYMYFGDFKN